MRTERILLIVGIGAAIYALHKSRNSQSREAIRSGTVQDQAQASWEDEGGSLPPERARLAGAI